MNRKRTITIGIVICLVALCFIGYGAAKISEANTFINALESGSRLFGSSSGSGRSLEVWAGHRDSAKIPLWIGIVTLIIGSVTTIAGVCSSGNTVAGRESSVNTADSLRELSKLHESGILTNEEYEAKRQELIQRI